MNNNTITSVRLRKPQMWLKKPNDTKHTRKSIKLLVITLIFQATINVLNMSKVITVIT